MIVDAVIGSESVRLVAVGRGGAIHWPSRETVIVADLHLGKAAAFRDAGIPVPEATTDATLSRLSRLLKATAATRLVILGDLLHSPAGRASTTMNRVAEWRTHHAEIGMVLVRGNHDRSAGDPPATWRIDCRDGPWVDGPFAMAHEPEQLEVIVRPRAQARAVATRARGSNVSIRRQARENAGPYLLAGHIHPAVSIGNGCDSLRAPCFWRRETSMILPAFGDFTGARCIRPGSTDQVYAVGQDEVVPVTC